jgi:hypothetical protein
MTKRVFGSLSSILSPALGIRVNNRCSKLTVVG